MSGDVRIMSGEIADSVRGGSLSGGQYPLDSIRSYTGPIKQDNVTTSNIILIPERPITESKQQEVCYVVQVVESQNLYILLSYPRPTPNCMFETKRFVTNVYHVFLGSRSG